MPLDHGRLDRFLRIEEVKQRPGDGAGGYEKVWGPIPGGEHVLGHVEPLPGEERIRATQQRSNATHQVTKAELTALEKGRRSPSRRDRWRRRTATAAT